MSTDSSVVKINIIPAARFKLNVRKGHEGVFDLNFRGDRELSDACFKKCQTAVKWRLATMDIATLEYLAVSIADGHLNESTRRSDLAHTIARCWTMRPVEVAMQLGLEDGDHCSYWFRQFDNSSPDCKFTQITLEWILSTAESYHEQCLGDIVLPQFLRQLLKLVCNSFNYRSLSRIRSSIHKVSCRSK